MSRRPAPFLWLAPTAVFLGVAALLAPVLRPTPALARQGGAPTAASTVDRTTPEATLKSFIAALNRFDPTTAKDLVEGTSPGALPRSFVDGLRESKAHIELDEVKIYTAGEDEACAVYTLHYAPLGAPLGKGSREFLILKRTGNAWAITAPSQSEFERRGNRDPMVLEAFAFLLRNPEVANQANLAAKMTLCKSNVKQVALALLMYSQDYDERFPPRAAAYKAAVMPYTKNEQVFRCPLDSAGPISYAFNERLARKSMASLAAPAATVMVYEGKNGKLDFRHNGGAIVGFADGHVQFVTAAEAAKLRWTP